MSALHNCPVWTCPAWNNAPRRAGFVLASLLPFFVVPAQAFEFDIADDVKARFDNTLSYGVAFRTQGADHNLAAEVDPASTTPYADLQARNIRTAANKNDGNLNFADAGELVSSTVKLNSLFEATWENFGAQVSGFAFYDKALADIEDTSGGYNDFINNVNDADLFDNERLPEDTADYAVSDVRLSSAYIWGDFEMGAHNVNIRFGHQVLSWGEALFFQDGINQANPADLSILRVPGAEVKDALLPLPMLVVSGNITDALSTEMFYEFGWNRSEADPVGTFYSTTDAFFGHGSEAVIIDLYGQSVAPLMPVYNGVKSGAPSSSTRVSINKTGDHDPDESGQFGLALRYLAESLNNSEFGVYFMNYHSRKPTAGAVLGDLAGAAVNGSVACQALMLATTTMGGVTNCATDVPAIMATPADPRYGATLGMNAVNYLDSTSYFLKYEEDLKVFGFTFSTNIGETSFSGELAYRPDATFLPELGDNLIAYNSVYAGALANSPSGVPVAAFGGHIKTVDGSSTLTAGEEIDLTADEDMMNVSLLAIHNFGPTLGLDGLTGILELGGAWVMGLDDKLYAAEGALGYVTTLVDTNGDTIPDSPALVEGSPDQYLDDFAWGYRLVLAAEFNDVFSGVNLKPQVRFAHDVEGNGVIGGNFMEDRQSALVAVDMEYGGNLTLGVGANTFWGRDGKNEGNQLHDRDNVFASVKYSF